MVNIDYSKMQASVNKPGHRLHGKIVFVEWSKINEQGNTILVVTDADEPFEFIEIEGQYVFHTLTAQERKDKIIIHLVSGGIYALLAIAFLGWMMGAFK